MIELKEENLPLKTMTGGFVNYEEANYYAEVDGQRFAMERISYRDKVLGVKQPRPLPFDHCIFVGSNDCSEDMLNIKESSRFYAVIFIFETRRARDYYMDNGLYKYYNLQTKKTELP